MKKFVTGYKGYIGRELLKRGFLPLDCDITDLADVQKSIRYAKPDLVVHLAGKSSIDFCEDKKNQKIVRLTNVEGAVNVFKSISEARIPCVYLSSDHVFHGGLFESHKESADPSSKQFLTVNFYGLCRLVAEQAARINGVNIVRTSYIFDSKRLENDLKFMGTGVIKYPTFIRRSFLHLYDFGDLMEMYCRNFHRMPKLLHLSGSGVVSWYTFAKEMSKQYSCKSPNPKFFDDPTLPPRPHNGGLNVNLALSLGFPNRNYIGGIATMRVE